MTEVVLDASAVLAVIFNEPGGDRATEALPVGVLSAVNAAEVVGRMTRGGLAASEAIKRLRSLPCEIVAVDEDVGLRAGEWAEPMRRHRLSLADRICMALAEQRGAPAITADRAWKDLDLGVEIVLIR